MPRSIWRGAISFGLVNVPVKLYSAVSKKTVRFNQLHEKDHQRIQMKRWCPGEDEEVPYDELVKGYEISPDRYVVITPEELEALDPKKTRTIDIEDFVDLDEIDPLYYEHPYYLVPDAGAAKAYKLLLTALKESRKVAIARVVIRQKEYLTAIRAADGVLTMETMLFADELVSSDSLDELPEDDVSATEREVEMAKQLIESLSTDFEPEKYHDEYRERVLDLIERKAQGEEITLEPVSDEPTKVPDLMAALEASLAEAKKRPATSKAKSNGRASANGDKAEAASGGSRSKASAKSSSSKSGSTKRGASKDSGSKSAPKRKTRQKAKA